MGLDIGKGIEKVRKKARSKYFDELASAKSISKEFNVGIGYTAPRIKRKLFINKTSFDTFTPFKPFVTNTKTRKKTKKQFKNMFDLNNIFVVKKGRKLNNAFNI